MKRYIILDLEWTSWKGNYYGNNQEKRKSWLEEREKIKAYGEEINEETRTRHK